MIKKHEQGKCPVCGSKDLNYEVFEYEGDGGYYPVECEKCHTRFEENYNLVYLNQDDIEEHYE